MDENKIYGSSDLLYHLHTLRNACTVLHVAAHPDDEDIGLLAYLSCKCHLRTIYWSATRGEGGQNRIGSEHDEALGIYRTWESLAARTIDRSESFFGPFYDFGYVKTADEVFARWGKENIIKELVRIIRLVQPHIIISRWEGTPDDFHGQHQAIGICIREAFLAASISKKFPELEKQHIYPWHPLKLYCSLDCSDGNTKIGGALNLNGRKHSKYEHEHAIRINTGEFDPIAECSYQERAWLAYNKHKTQAIGVLPTPKNFYYYYKLINSLMPTSNSSKESDFFSGLDISLLNLCYNADAQIKKLTPHLKGVLQLLDQATEQFNPEDTTKTGKLLISALTLLRKTQKALTSLKPQKPYNKKNLAIYLERKETVLQECIARCLELELDTTLSTDTIIPGETLRLTTQLWNYKNIKLSSPFLQILFNNKKIDKNSSAAQNIFTKTSHLITIAETANLSTPYWLQHPKSKCKCFWPNSWPNNRWNSYPFAASPIQIQYKFTIEKEIITLTKTPMYRQAFPGGYHELPLSIIPPISIVPQTEHLYLQTKDKYQTIDLIFVIYNNSKKTIRGKLEILLPKGWHSNANMLKLTLKGKTADIASKTKKISITIPKSTKAGHYNIDYCFHYSHRKYSSAHSCVMMRAADIPGKGDESNCIKKQFIISPATSSAHIIDVNFIDTLHYAYVEGAKETLLSSLQNFGLTFHLIKDEEMAYLDLSAFDTIIIGPNAYSQRAALRKHAHRFLHYVEKGGYLLVQYQKYMYQSEKYAPYHVSYQQPHDRVTSPTAPVTILDKNNILFRLPNKITKRDFDHWHTDRGIYFFHKWNHNYIPLLACADQGEPPQLGGLLFCNYGQGIYLYTGYSFTKQIPNGVSGAIRLFANMLALPEARIQERITFLRKTPLFANLNNKELDVIARIIHERHLKDNAFLCHQGEKGSELYIIKEGLVEIIQFIDNKEKIIYTAKPGEAIGELAILGEIPRTASMRTKGDTHVLVIEKILFQNLLRSHADMALKVINLLVTRLNPVKKHEKK